MLLNTSGLTETNCNIQGNTFKISASPVAFDILSSKLYSNPILAIVRELLTNAYDSHKAAGKENIPIKVNIPSYLEPNFIIRDYGLGLSKEDVMEMYTTFFSSTKSDSNDFTGCFGLGSKTPFSYTTSFSVNSYWNGTKYYFIATKKDGLPNIFFVKEEPTEEENGLEISIPIDKSGGFDYKFHNEMVNYLKYIPEIKVDTPKEIVRRVPLISKDVFKLYEKEISSYSWDRGICYIKQGQNIYKANDFIDKYGQGAEEAGEIDLSTLHYFFNYCDVVIEVPIGTLSITPSRESLSQEEENIAKVEEQILKINDYLKLCLIEEIDSFNIAGSNLNKLYNELMTEKFFGEEHPLGAKITQRNSYGSDDKVGCELHKCYLHSVDYSGLNKNVLITQNKKSIVLLVPSTFNHAGIQKLKNTINNYDELDEVNIYIIMTYGGRLHYDSSFLTFARNVKKTIQILNSMEEYDFNVELQTINSFYRKYTNHKKQRDTSYDPSEKRIRYKYASIAPKCKSEGKSARSGGGTGNTKYIKERYKEENTIVIFKEAPKTFNYTSKKASVVRYFLQNIKDKEGNNFVYEYLKELLPNLDNLQMIHFLEISKTAKKYFKEYEITSFDRIFEFIQEADWLIANPVEETLLEFVTEFDDMFKANFKPKAYDFISRTKSYYKLTKLKAIAENNTTIRNTLNEYALSNLPKYFPKMVNKEAYSSLSKNILSDKLRKLLNIFDCSRKGYKSHWSRKRNEWEDGNTHFRLLSKTHRLEVLGLLKGDL